MKKVPLNGKLSIQKESIASLTDAQMSDVEGGVGITKTWICIPKTFGADCRTRRFETRCINIISIKNA